MKAIEKLKDNKSGTNIFVTVGILTVCVIALVVIRMTM